MDKENTATPQDRPAAVEGRGAVILICAIMLVSVLLFGAVDSGALVILSVLSFVLASIWLWTAFRSGSFTVSAEKMQMPLAALLLVGLIQLMPVGASNVPEGLVSTAQASTISLDPYATRLFVFQLLLLLIFFSASLTFINSLPVLRAVTVFLLAFGGVLAFYSILQRVEDPSSIYGLRRPDQAIPFGTYVNRHHFAALMEMLLGLAVGLLLAGGLKAGRWPFVAAAAVLMGIAISLTGSRGGMIAMVSVLVIATAMVAMRNRGRGHKGAFAGSKLTAAFGVLFFLTVVVIVIYMGGADPLLRGIGVEPGTGDVASGRIGFWKTAMWIFLDHPVFGAGLDAFGVAYTAYDQASGVFRVEQAHNDYLQILADSGVVGFACVAAFIFLFVKRGLEVIRETATGFRLGAAVGAFAGCAGLMVHSFFDFPLRTPANSYVFLAIAAIAIVSVRDDNRSIDAGAASELQRTVT